MEVNEVLRMANECLKCKNPLCVKACPINMNIPDFINCIKEKNFDEAKKIIVHKSYLGSICGRVCPHDKQCEGSCIKGIKGNNVQIGALESYTFDRSIKFDVTEELKNLNVAIIGSGPAGLQCAARLRSKGANVTIYEKESTLGGILTYGIPDMRLPKDIVKKVINDIFSMGINVKTNSCFGIDYNVNDLKSKGYDIIFLAIGAEISKMLNIVGSDLQGVYGANEFLRNHDLRRNENVVVVGGGNVAMDVACVSAVGGAKVTVIYRKKKENMPANLKEIELAEDLGVKLIFEENVEQMIGNKVVNSVKISCGDIIKADKVIMAIGSEPNKSLLTEFEKNDNGLLKVDEYGETSIRNVYAGGDLTEPKATVCMAIKTANTVADRIINLYSDRMEKDEIKV